MTHDQYLAACDAAWAKQMARAERADMAWVRGVDAVREAGGDVSEANDRLWTRRQAELEASLAEQAEATRAAREAWEAAGGGYGSVGRLFGYRGA